MLNRLTFTNFKTWAAADVECGKVTGLFGTNASGKTSLLQFLLMLKQTKEATDRALSLELNGRYVELGTISDAIHQHDETRAIGMSLMFRPDKPLALNDATGNRQQNIASGATIAMAAEIDVVNRAPHARKLTYRLGDAEFLLAPANGKNAGFVLDTNLAASDFRFLRNPGRAWALSGPVKSYAFPDQARTYSRMLASCRTWRLPTRRQSTASSIWVRCATTQSGIISGPGPDRPMLASAATRQSMPSWPRPKRMRSVTSKRAVGFCRFRK